MTVIAFNGSPRKTGTTAMLLRKALEGAASRGTETEFVQLNTLTMKGCQGCFSCKKRGGESYGKCILRDDMTPFYEKIEQADAIFLGSPIYFGSVTAECKMVIDRMFPYVNFGTFSSNIPRKIPTGLIYTLGAEAHELDAYNQHFQFQKRAFTLLFGSAEVLVSTSTFHVEDYSTIVADALEPLVEGKRQYRENVFPQDCEKAFNMGAGFVQEGKDAGNSTRQSAPLSTGVCRTSGRYTTKPVIFKSA